MIKAVFFGLDGTLVPMDEKKFIKLYIDSLFEEVKQFHIEKEIFTRALMKGLMAMINNDGFVSNENLFWEVFDNALGMKLRDKKEIFDKYYLNNFKCVKFAAGESPESKKIIEFCRVLGLKTILSTNPIFPKQAVITRMNFVGLTTNDFDYITSYENSFFCKPNPKYFASLLKELGLKPEEVLVFGNNKEEDCYCSAQAGIKSYLVDNRCLIIPDSVKDEQFECIKINEVNDVIQREIERNKTI